MKKTHITLFFILGTILGVIGAVYSYYHQSISGLYFSTLATVQASIFGIVAAIYILGRQLTASEYTTRALNTIQGTKPYQEVIFVFGLSLVVCFVSILIAPDINQNPVLMSVMVPLVFYFFISSFVFLYTIRDIVSNQINPDEIQDHIQNKIDYSLFLDEISTEDSYPFYDFFETARSAIQEEDRQAAYTIIGSVETHIATNISSFLDSHDSINETQEENLANIFTEFKHTGVEAAKRGYIPIIASVVAWSNKMGDEFAKNVHDIITKSAINTISEVHKELSDENAVTAVQNGVWHSYTPVLQTASEKDLEKSIYSGTLAIAELITNASDRYEEFDADKAQNMLIVSVLIGQFMDCWTAHAEHYLDRVSPENLLYNDKKFLEPLEFRYNHNHYLDNFTSIIIHISSANRNSVLPAGGFDKICRSSVEGLAKIAKIASDNGQQELVYYYTEAAILVAFGFGSQINTAARTNSILNELQNYSNLSEKAVDDSLEHLSDLDDDTRTLAQFHFGGAYVHQDFEESELEEYASTLQQDLDSN